MGSTGQKAFSAIRLAVAMLAVAPLLAACGGFFGDTGVRRAAFTSKEFGVAVSPRVSWSKTPKHGGGRYMVGKPYEVRGKWYVPKDQPNYAATGVASWYGNDFHGRLTANGEIFSANAISGGHPTLPLPSYVRVTNLDNGRALTVRINDRGPYMDGRIIDLSQRSAELLGFINEGTADVKVEYVGPAPLNGDDTRTLLASLDTSHQFAPVTQVASNSRSRRSGNPGGLIGDVMNLFSYADEQKAGAEINSAHAAVDAMASRTPQLQDWVESTDLDARRINLSLGIFTEQEASDSVEMSFAMLGKVEERPVTLDGRSAMQLVLTVLKPGVAREDALNMARNLGLNDISLLGSTTN